MTSTAVCRYWNFLPVGGHWQILHSQFLYMMDALASFLAKESLGSWLSGSLNLSWPNSAALKSQWAAHYNFCSIALESNIREISLIQGCNSKSKGDFFCLGDAPQFCLDHAQHLREKRFLWDFSLQNTVRIFCMQRFLGLIGEFLP